MRGDDKYPQPLRPLCRPFGSLRSKRITAKTRNSFRYGMFVHLGFPDSIRFFTRVLSLFQGFYSLLHTRHRIVIINLCLHLYAANTTLIHQTSKSYDCCTNILFTFLYCIQYFSFSIFSLLITTFILNN